MHHISYDIYHISPNVFSHHHKNLHQHHDPSQHHEDHHGAPPSQGVFTLTQTVHSNVSIFSPEDAMCCSDDPIFGHFLSHFLPFSPADPRK